MIGLVLDTNVLVSANLSAEGLEALVVSLVLNRKVRLYVSAAILEEYERVLLYPRFRFEPQEVSRFLAALRRAGQYPRVASLRIALSRLKSPTSCFNRPFSRSSSFNRLACSVRMPP